MQAVVDFEDMIPDEPDEIGKVWNSCAISDELEHGRLLHSEDIQSQGSDYYPDHLFAVVEELDCFCVQRKVVRVLVKEEVDGVGIQFEGQGLEEGDVIGHHFLVREIELVNYDRVDVIVRQQII